MIDKNIIVILGVLLIIGYLMRRRENFDLRYQNCNDENPKYHCDLDKETVIYPPPYYGRYNRFQVPENLQSYKLDKVDSYWR